MNDLVFHHFGLAVSAPQKAIAFLRVMQYEVGEEVYDPLQKVFLRMCVREGEPNVELVYKADEGGPLDRMLSGKKELIYHTCYSTESIADSVAAIKTSGIRILLVSAAKPAVLFGNKPVAFYFVDGYGLIEMLETGKK